MTERIFKYKDIKFKQRLHYFSLKMSNTKKCVVL